jgi:hypothetical protein
MSESEDKINTPTLRELKKRQALWDYFHDEDLELVDGSDLRITNPDGTAFFVWPGVTNIHTDWHEYALVSWRFLGWLE